MYILIRPNRLLCEMFPFLKLAHILCDNGLHIQILISLLSTLWVETSYTYAWESREGGMEETALARDKATRDGWRREGDSVPSNAVVVQLPKSVGGHTGNTEQETVYTEKRQRVTPGILNRKPYTESAVQHKHSWTRNRSTIHD